jgi:hypothetical protein
LIRLLVPPLALLLAALAAAGAFLLFLLFRFAAWALQGGSQVRVPWTVEVLRHPTSRFAERRRTRDGAFLRTADPHHCTLVFWRRSLSRSLDLVRLEQVMRDAVTGFTGIETIAADFSLEGRGERWLITSTALKRQGLCIDGPHYEPWSACAGSALARVDFSRHLNSAQLLADLKERIRDRTVHHQCAPWAFVTGRTSPHRVTCSGLIGAAILRQPTSPAAMALQQALKERFTYGEVTPADMARCASILELRETHTGEPFRLIRVLRRAPGPKPLARRATRPLAADISPDILK